MKAVVLPGLDGTGAMLTEFAARLSERNETAVLTYPRNRVLSYLELADFVTAQLPQGQPYAVIAESFSGPVAALVAARRPLGLAGLAFAASFVRKPVPLPPWVGGLTWALPLKSQVLLSLARPFAFGRWADSASMGNLVQAVAPVSHNVLAGRIDAILKADYRDELAGLDIPLLYLRPRYDRLVRASTVLEMARVNPALAVRTIDGPHFVLQTRATEAAEIIGDFIADLKPSPASRVR